MSQLITLLAAAVPGMPAASGASDAGAGAGAGAACGEVFKEVGDLL